MSKAKEADEIIHSTKSGRLYIKAHDFFSQPKVQKMVSDLINSDIYKSIEKHKSGRR
jgi:hypothetical protein